MVVPFERRGAKKPAPLDGAVAGLHPRARRGDQRAAKLAADQSITDRVAYGTAQARVENERLIAAGKVVPARITLAMNLRGLEGPEVDIECGTVEGNRDPDAGDVDMWELGLAVPTREQVELMAKLTDFPPAWFYRPMEPGPLLAGAGSGEAGFLFMCGPGGCTIVESDYVDEDGVLQYGGEPRRTLPEAALPFDPGERAERPKRPAAPRKKTPAKKAAAAPKTSNTMPLDLRAELEAKLASAKARRRQ